MQPVPQYSAIFACMYSFPVAEAGCRAVGLFVQTQVILPHFHLPQLHLYTLYLILSYSRYGLCSQSYNLFLVFF